MMVNEWWWWLLAIDDLVTSQITLYLILMIDAFWAKRQNYDDDEAVSKDRLADEQTLL